MKDHPDHAMPALDDKFRQQNVSAKGATRATVPFRDPKAQWFNTGTLFCRSGVKAPG